MEMLDDVIDREPKVCEDTGLSASTLFRKVKAGTFPAPVRLGANSKGWKRSEVRAWIAALRCDQIPPRTSAVGAAHTSRSRAKCHQRHRRAA